MALLPGLPTTSFFINRIAGPLARLSRVEWDIDQDGARVHAEFASFVSSVVSDLRRKREEDEITILRE